MPTTDLLRLLLDVSGRANDDDDDGDPLWWLRREVCLSLSLYITVHYPAAISTLIVKSYIAAGSGDTLLSLLFPSRLDRRDSPTGRRESQYNLKLKEGEIE